VEIVGIIWIGGQVFGIVREEAAGIRVKVRIKEMGCRRRVIVVVVFFVVIFVENRRPHH